MDNRRRGIRKSETNLLFNDIKFNAMFPVKVVHIQKIRLSHTKHCLSSWLAVLLNKTVRHHVMILHFLLPFDRHHCMRTSKRRFFSRVDQFLMMLRNSCHQFRKFRLFFLLLRIGDLFSSWIFHACNQIIFFVSYYALNIRKIIHKYGRQFLLVMDSVGFSKLQDIYVLALFEAYYLLLLF